MNMLVAEYRSLPAAGERLSDPIVARKLEIVRALDEEANLDPVSRLLLDLLRDATEPDPVRAEAIEVVGLYIDESSALWQELFHEVLRIHRDPAAGEALKQAAEPYAVFLTETLGT